MVRIGLLFQGSFRVRVRCALFAVALCCVLGTWTVGLHGCVVMTPAALERDLSAAAFSDLPSDFWPRRSAAPILDLMRPPHDEDAAALDRYSANIARLIGLSGPRLRHTEMANGVMYELANPAADGRQLLFITNRLDSEALQRALDRSLPSRVEQERLLRWHFRLQTPQHTPRGLIVHLTSMGDRRFERRVSRTLVDRGWAVLYVAPGRTIVPYLHERVIGEGRRIVPAREIASVLDEFAADYAYAVEAAIEYLASEIPVFEADRGRPIVLTGYSAGSLAAPTVAARLNGRISAAVLVGGGANVGGILADGRITNVVQVLRQTGEPHLVHDLRRMPPEYLASSRFDPYHTAAYLRDTPVLMLQGQLDQIVPPQYGDLLYERLGRPERWTYPVGHIMLFWALPSQAGRIADWIERAVAER
jgi:fermentation-respiration switch protein FrsA (DUF1100 family)